ncbi:hypothetical protein MG293_005397 [Ovis ammon polii]|uniref:HSF-type DNA-binding domain-containing protein n=1 Tax=Ovis ammon polii TaxID=230172 RepID=A0AAD4UH43_OVIAM|nr:hypothetical protein MG293_005397 [Ovis ammon polii]
MPGRTLTQVPEAPDSNEDSERNQAGAESGVPGIQAAKRVNSPRDMEAASPWRSHQTCPGLAGRGRGEQMPLQMSCHPGLHEDICAVGPRLGPQPQGALQDVYVTALITVYASNVSTQETSARTVQIPGLAFLSLLHKMLHDASEDLKSVLHTADEELSRSTDRTTEIGSGLSVVVLAQLMPTGHHSFRLLLEESTFQALRKLWTIVNSHRFVSIWWAEDSTCVGVSEEHFENILERVGSDKVFETDHKKSLFHQLSLY